MTDIAKMILGTLAVFVMAGCDTGPKVCNDGYLFSDPDGDGIYTGQTEGINSVECVDPSKEQTDER